MKPSTQGSAAHDARTLPPGTRLGRYVLSHRVARGGMAELYLAKATGADGFKKTVALKLVLPHLKDDGGFMEMFRHEASLSARLDHPNIAQVFDLGFDRGEYFIAMEYVHGRNVAKLMSDADSIPLDCGLSIVAGACDALAYAHDLPTDGGEHITIVHRDVSPGNVLLRFDGIVKLVDFGIAKALTGTKHTRTGTIKGKAGYMSPEQCRALPLDRRSDVYCLGILLYELATGHRAFGGHSDFTIMNAIISGDYTRPREHDPHFPKQLEDIIDRALSVDREDRFPTTSAMREELEDFAAGEGLTLGAAPIRRFVRELWGEVPLPQLRIESTSPGDSRDTLVSDAFAAPPTPSAAPGPGRRLLSYVLVAAVAAAIATYVAWRPAQSPASNPTPAAVTEQAITDQATDPPVERPQPQPVTAPTSTSPAASPDAAEPEEDPPPAATKQPGPKKRKPKRAKKASAKSPAGPTQEAPPAVSGDDDLRPPSLRN